jgi:hypothetical protein
MSFQSHRLYVITSACRRSNLHNVSVAMAPEVGAGVLRLEQPNDSFFSISKSPNEYLFKCGSEEAAVDWIVALKEYALNPLLVQQMKKKQEEDEQKRQQLQQQQQAPPPPPEPIQIGTLMIDADACGFISTERLFLET